ncbi:MAG: SGNH/GDSL hydrolase family protein, partial [Chloroflexota bacterium]
MTRRFWLAALIAAAFLISLAPSVATATPPLPASMAAVGDSITQAASSGGGLGTDYPQNSWSTGTNATVNSHYLRLLALNSAISGRNYNRSVSGAKMADLNGQMQNVVALQ